MTSAFGEMPVESCGVCDKRAKGRDRGNHEFVHRFSIAGRFDISLAKVHDVAARLNFARAPKIRFRHGHAFKEIRTENDAPRRNDLAELEWKGIARPRELRFEEKQRRVEAELFPCLVQGGTAIEVADCQALDDGAGVRVAAERRNQS